jgi:TRAP-type C4-dicarboxylate transport system substrate-binding protein
MTQSKSAGPITRRRALALAGAALAAPAILRATAARAADATLKLHHFLPAKSNCHVRFLQPWADLVAEKSGGRLAVEIYPAMSLGGKPPQLFDQARDGVVDLVWTLPGYTPGRFPKAETFELPFIAARESSVNSRAMQDFAERNLTDEYADVHPICFWCNDQGVIHSKTPVRKLEDMEGLKIRFPSKLTGDALKALGAAAVGMPVPQIPESIAQGVIEGAIVPWEVVPALKLQELVSSHTEFAAGQPTLYTSVHNLIMNKASYEALPEDLRGVLDGLSGQTASAMAAKAWDDEAPVARKLATDRGNEVITIEAAEIPRWMERTQPVIDAWVQATPGGAELLADAKATIAKYAAA